MSEEIQGRSRMFALSSNVTPQIASYKKKKKKYSREMRQHLDRVVEIKSPVRGGRRVPPEVMS